MSKMSELSMLLDSLIECGEKLTETAKGLKDFYTDTGEPEQPEKPNKVAAPKPESENKPTLKKEDVRLLLSKKASEDKGHYKVQVKNLVRKYAKPKYSVSLIIPKDDTVTVERIKAAVQAAYEEGESKLKGNSKTVPPLSAIKTPLRDGDLEKPDDPAYANSYFINANSDSAPDIVDADRQPILERREVYSGVYGRASINLYAFNTNGNKGIACGLNNLQKIRDGEPLGGKSRAEDDFADDDNDDFLN